MSSNIDEQAREKELGEQAIKEASNKGSKQACKGAKDVLDFCTKNAVQTLKMAD